MISRVNILNQDFSTKTICEKWTADITYISTKKNRWCYLSSIMDLHTKKIISYTFSKRMTVDCVIQTLNKAKKYYHIPEGNCVPVLSPPKNNFDKSSSDIF
ncbi:hypothetical protein EY693_03785 [Enterococcus casseliflavus]|uniref:DDE-type integrase/transposase/recombinase n=1 Tax=Enterococcus casseliflavus TaxID=37734 RepID=UPI001AD6975B|nr:hypothetical protein [Enterococcus casseliflavus]MBO6375463.1 hypothetical protein [Enterococcus casseliflavus]